MVRIFENYKKQLTAWIENDLKHWQKSHGLINRWGSDVIQRILPFIKSGKMIRGALVLLSSEMYGGRSALPVGAAMEFFQSGFLIHDDIMDRDFYRRGKPSLYYQYQNFFEKEGLRENLQAGLSFGICAGDLVFFRAYEALNQAECSDKVRKALFERASTEYSKVTLAQMEDLYFGFYDGEVEEEEILNVYRYKTARYTFSLPFMMGAIFAEADPHQIEILSEMGESLGLIFQIKDDEIGIFGESEVIGKPAGSDISENKKTLFRLYLMQASDESEKKELSELFGKRELSKEDLILVRNQMKEKGVLQKVKLQLEGLEAKTRAMLETLNIDLRYRKILSELIDYSLLRKI